MATLYYKVTPSGPIAGYAPNSSYLSIGGVETYTSDYDQHWDSTGEVYFKFSISAVSWEKPADYLTATYELDHNDQDHSPYSAWKSLYISDPEVVVLPPDIELIGPDLGLTGPFKFNNSDKTSFGFNDIEFNLDTKFVGSYDFGGVILSTQDNLKTIAEKAFDVLGAGLGNLKNAIENVVTVKDALYNVADGALNLISTGISGIDDPDFDADAFGQQVDSFFSGAQGTLNQAVIDTTLFPDNPAAEALADELLESARFVGTVVDTGSIPVSGTVGLDFTVSVGGAEFTATIEGTVSADLVIDGATDSIIEGGAGDDILLGGGGNDTIHAGTGEDYVYGGEGTDTLYGAEDAIGMARLAGGKGNDTYFVNNTSNQIVELSEDGKDTIETTVNWTLGNNLENLRLSDNLAPESASIEGHGNSLNNIIAGNSGQNKLFGEAGNDRLNGGSGADELFGGVGNDTYSVDDINDKVVEVKSEGVDKIFSSVSYDLKGTYVEFVQLIGNNNLDILGNTVDNTLIGNSGNNILNGQGGVDSFLGGLGNDTYYVDSQSDKVAENKSEGTDKIISANSYNLTGTYVEVLQLTGSGNFNASGNSLSNSLIGNTGNNIFNGKGGKDSFAGGLGNDTYYVDSQSDTVTELKGEGADKIFSSSSYNLSGTYVEVLQLTGSANINATGNSVSNTLIGNSSNNILKGQGGTDILIGAGGNDTYYVDSQSDTVTELKGEGVDKIFSSSSYSLSGTYVEVLQLTGSGNLNATGNSVNNTLIGNSGNNLLNGQGGTDIFTGGSGQDTAIYDLLNAKDSRGGNGSDSWTDFLVGKVASNVNADKIDISDLLTSYSGNGSALSLKAYVKLLHDGDDTVLQIDRDGSGGSYGFSTLLTLNNVNVDLATLLSNQQLLV